MLELTGMGSVLRGLGVLYWLLATGAIALALWKGKTPKLKAIWTAVAIVVFGFLPVKEMIEQARRDAFAREAWAYFTKKCDTEAGEKIYKTYSGVKSVLVVKPLPPASEKDLFDQFWYGDPYSGSAHSDRGFHEAATLTSYSRRAGELVRGLEFVEIKTQSGEGYKRVTRPSSVNGRWHVDNIEKPTSRFGVAWEDISTPEDRKYWVAGSRLSVIDLRDNSLVAERIGYLIEAGFGSTAGQRRPWLTSRGPRTTCPPLLGGAYSDNWFITKVFRQDEEK